MKRVLALIFAATIAIGFMPWKLQAQCTPGNYTQPGVYPDPATGLPDAVASQYYETVLTVVVPQDTTIPGLGTIPLDSSGVIAVNGLPPGVDWVTNSPTNFWDAGTSGCILISGTPVLTDTGSYNVDLELEVHAPGYQVPMPISGYVINVLDTSHVNVEEPKNSLDVVAFPSPFTHSLSLEIKGLKTSVLSVELYNMVGKSLLQKQINITEGANTYTIDTSALPSGIYFYRVSYGDKVITRKVIKR